MIEDMQVRNFHRIPDNSYVQQLAVCTLFQ